jgi:hypothetical protein
VTDGTLLRGVHLLVLWTFALAQPTFAELDKQPSPIANAGGIDLVLFAAGLTFLPPAVLLLLELAAARAGERALRSVHLALVVGLAAVIASPVVFRALTPSSAVQTVLALGAGAVAGIAYARVAPVRSFVTVLAPAPLLFVALFLFTGPAGDIVLGRQDDVPSFRTAARAPVVFVVFDEFTSTALMNSSGQLDAARYPSFGRLAEDATWFRNATTDHSFTELAVPSMLTGMDAPQDTVPWASDHPRNLFTLLSGSHRLHVVEQITDLCPERLCPERGSFPGRLPSLYRDLVVLGLEATLPDAVSVRLPKIGLPDLTPQEEFERLMSGVRSAAESRSLHFAHVSLPHSPHDRLPSGQRYSTDVQGVAGGGPDHWVADPWLASQGYQRYLLQVGYTDRLLGELLDELEKAGIYERAAVVVTADHGVSHRPGDRRRSATPTNLEEIMPVPLFVKAPYQRRGRVIDRHLQTVDILPTLADVLGVRLPFDTDGTSAFDAGLNRRRLKLTNLHGRALWIDAVALDGRRDATLRRQVALFGEGSDPERPYEGGLDPALRGRRVADLRVDPGGPSHAVIEGPASFDVDPRSEVVPARVAGRLTGRGTKPMTRLVIALNGRVETATRTYESRGDVWFTTILPPSKLRPGRNTVEVFALSRARGKTLLESLGRSS